MTAIHADGRVYCSNAVIDGRFGLRACIVNFRTEAEDVERLLAVAAELAAAVRSSGRQSTSEGGDVSDADKEPYADPGRETGRREDMPDEYSDVGEFVEQVSDPPDEHLEKRVDDTFENQAEDSQD